MDPAVEISLLVILLGLLVAVSLGLKGWVARIGLPPMVAFLAIGFLLRLGEDTFGFLPQTGPRILELIANVGIVCMLFRVGLESDLARLLAQLRSSILVWICNVAASGALGYVTAFYILDLAVIPSLVVAVALTATSIAIPAQIWRSSGAMQSPNGQRFVEVAELDDISAVVLMALLFWIVGDIQHGADNNIIAAKLGRGLLEFGVKFAFFVAFCFVFARYLERPLTNRIQNLVPAPDPMLSIAGIAFVIAGIAGLLGFSLAVGAFFAGLAFSRDPRAVRIEASFESIYELFTPFFFIHIGFLIAPSAFLCCLPYGGVLLVAAVAGKIIGTLFPARLRSNWPDAWILSVSMVPRSEIALLIMQTGLLLGPAVVPDSILPGMVLVCATTSVLAPILLQRLLKKRAADLELQA